METHHPKNGLIALTERIVECAAGHSYRARLLYGSRWTMCPECARANEERAAIALREQESRREAARLERALQDRLRFSGLFGRYERSTFETFEVTSAPQRKALTTCRDFAESLKHEPGGLWLIGPPGTGKTHLGSAIVNHLVRERAMTAAIHSARELVRMLRSTWGQRENHAARSLDDSIRDKTPRTESQMVNHLGGLDLLVLDEVGFGFGSDSEMVQLFDVIDLRYQAELPSVLLSNLLPESLKPALGDRNYDRLREGAVIVPCNWTSYRGRKHGG